MKKKSRQEAIEDLTLALLYLTSFPDGEGNRFDEIAWKNYDFDAIDRLDEQALIVNPIRIRGGAYKYAYMTEKGRSRAREILNGMGIEDKPVYERFEFRSIRPEEAGVISDIESVCFPPNEACSRAFIDALASVNSERFLAAVDRENGKIAGCLYGLATDETSFNDDFFTEVSTHDPEGHNIMLLGLEVLPEYRKLGLARELVFNYCRREQERGIRRLILTCHAEKVTMYKRLGFTDIGESVSTWGGSKWHEMYVILNW